MDLAITEQRECSKFEAIQNTVQSLNFMLQIQNLMFPNVSYF